MFYTKLFWLIATLSNFPSLLATRTLWWIRWRICSQRIRSPPTMSIMCHHNFFTTEPGNHSCRYPYKRFNTQCYTRWLSALKPHPQNPKTPRTNRRRSSWFLKNTWLKICRVAAAAQVQHKLEAVLFYQEYQHPAKLPLRLLRTGRASIQTSEKHNKDLIMRKQDRISNLNFFGINQMQNATAWLR